MKSDKHIAADQVFKNISTVSVEEILAAGVQLPLVLKQERTVIISKRRLQITQILNLYRRRVGEPCGTNVPR